jgi:hypothetical protein
VSDEEQKNLPAHLARLEQNLRAAAATTGSGQGGASFLKVDDRSGALVVGANRDPFPSKHRYVVGLHTFYHGYIVF